MMCIACEQAVWFAQSQRKGLIAPGGFPVEEPPFVAATIEPPSSLEKNKDERAGESANKDKFSCE
jgi:hypothetical protein